MIRFEMYVDRVGEYRWRLVAANNQIVCWSEGYNTPEGAKDSVRWTKHWASLAPVQAI